MGKKQVDSKKDSKKSYLDSLKIRNLDVDSGIMSVMVSLSKCEKSTFKKSDLVDGDCWDVGLSLIDKSELKKILLQGIDEVLSKLPDQFVSDGYDFYSIKKESDRHLKLRLKEERKELEKIKISKEKVKINKKKEELNEFLAENIDTVKKIIKDMSKK